MAELEFPVPPLADGVASLRPWREADVPGKLLAFSDPVVQRFSWPHPTPYTEADARRFFAEQEAARRSHIPFKDGRRDTVVYSLLPGELR